MKRSVVILTLILSVATLYAVPQKPKVTMKKARMIALAKVPGGTIASSELENEGGKLIYSFDIKTKDRKSITEVNVDAMNGNVVAVQNESPAKEAAEKKAEQQKH